MAGRGFGKRMRNSFFRERRLRLSPSHFSLSEEIAKVYLKDELPHLTGFPLCNSLFSMVCISRSQNPSPRRTLSHTEKIHRGAPGGITIDDRRPKNNAVRASHPDRICERKSHICLAALRAVPYQCCFRNI